MSPAHDFTSPWGTFSPSRTERVWLGICRAVQQVRPAAALALLMRRPLKYGRDTPLDVELWGLRLRLARRDSVSESRMLFTPRLFDRVERDAVLDRLRAGATFIDVGANAGGYSFWVAQRFRRDVHILAIEADPEMARRIRFNIATNAADCIQLAEAAVSDSEGEGTLVIGTANRGENFLSTDGRTHGVSVRMRTLLDLLIEHDVARVDLLKIDIEGLEYRVLSHFFAHAPATLHPCSILLEMKDSPDHRELLRRLSALGYVVALRTGRNVMLDRRAEERESGRA